MVTIGIDAHKRTHTAVAVDEQGRELGSLTIEAGQDGHLRLLGWARAFGERWFAVEDCRHLSRRLEGDLLGAGERIVRVPPKLMAHARAGGRAYGKSDTIDALAVARAAIREPNLPVARLDGAEREVRLISDHRDDLVSERKRIISRMRWTLHEINPALEPPPRTLIGIRTLDRLNSQLDGYHGRIVGIARDQIRHCRQLTLEINQLYRELQPLVEKLAPTLLTICGCGVLTAAKIIGETANITRFRSAAAYARHNGTAPTPVGSGNNHRHRLSRTGNRQLNAALHRIALTQARLHPDAKALIARRKNTGNTGLEALRVLKRHLSNIVYRALQADAHLLT